MSKPVSVAEDWQAAEQILRARLAAAEGKSLVLVNQPSTGAADLNRRIVAFAENG